MKLIIHELEGGQMRVIDEVYIGDEDDATLLKRHYPNRVIKDVHFASPELTCVYMGMVEH